MILSFIASYELYIFERNINSILSELDTNSAKGSKLNIKIITLSYCYTCASRDTI
jgi:hypothetical protein